MSKRAAILFALAILFAFPAAVYADIAPPEEPPGANIAPNNEVTQVRMEAETVIIDVFGDSSGQAAVTATFSMRNLGTETESLLVRFPLTFWDGQSDGNGGYPEITDLRVKVNGVVAPTSRINTNDPPVPWSAFEAAFPPNEVVEIEVKYTATATQEFEGGPPFIAFGYVLETGAGWKDTIGSADLIVRLPYEAEIFNVILDPGITGFASTTPGAEFRGTEVRWHYDDLEPTREHNLEIALIDPALWLQVLTERDNVARDPQDGEAWGRLGRLYKDALKVRKSVRTDPAAVELFELSADAYQQAVTLLPEDALWHAGYGQLLAEYYGELQWMGRDVDADNLNLAFKELQLAYELDPDNEKILEILEQVSYIVPGGIAYEGEAYVFAYLTATPTPRVFVTETSEATSAAEAPATTVPTQESQPSPTAAMVEEVTPVPDEPFLPMCGLGLALLPIGLLLTNRKQRRKRSGVRQDKKQ